MAFSPGFTHHPIIAKHVKANDCPAVYEYWRNSLRSFGSDCADCDYLKVTRTRKRKCQPKPFRNCSMPNTVCYS